MGPLNIRPGDRLIKNYYESLHQFGQLDFDHEGAVRSAFQAVLDGYGKRLEWKLVPEYPYKKVRVDGALLDTWRQRRGFWEAKDAGDDLEKEIRKKIEVGYPTTNIIFQAPQRAILYQRGMRVGLNENIEEAKNLVELLQQFFSYKEPEHEEWDKAVDDFSERLPEIAKRAKDLIDHERISNKAFRERFEEFYALCKRSINPNLSFEAVEEMLIQHLLTERIFRKVFRAEEFRSRNVIAQEIEKVISSLTSRHFSRDAFLSELDRFYKAIERSAQEKSDYTEKQDFLNTVYERFFQGYSPKEADTHGIVYTPQPIVDFMVRSVEDILKKEFGKSLSDKGVHILDPFVGTGNFIVRIMREIKTSALPYKFENELHCNEVMLLPYYIASMNIEHEYYEKTGEYRPFPGICLVDTFELAEAGQGTLSFMSEENTARVKRQKESPIFVIIGNPPYNAWQANESDNNKNRKYATLDGRVSETYARTSRATNKNSLSDVYVKAFRWASDRIGKEGLITFVSNNGFLTGMAFDGMRAALQQEFSAIYHLDLKGNAHTTGEERRRQAGNVFDDAIRVGIGITVLVRKESRGAPIYYCTVDDYISSKQKQEILAQYGNVSQVPWQQLTPDGRANWLTAGLELAFQKYVPLAGGLFDVDSPCVKTNRDAWAYNFDREKLAGNIRRTIRFYSQELRRASKELPRDADQEALDAFVSYKDQEISWSRDLKADLKRGREVEYRERAIREGLYRPFVKQWLYFDRVLNEEVYSLLKIYPTADAPNKVVWWKTGLGWPQFALMTDAIPDQLPQGGSDCFPFYIYEDDGTNRRENITDWALNEFRTHYKDPKISKWDIFHYVYGLLHSPEYRERYAANLKRELPRIPFAPDFWGFAKAGERLADLHVNYEKQPEYPLERIENPKEKLNLRVEKMRLSKDKSLLIYNSFLTLKGIPPEAYDYRLGNRSALEWIVDQYQVSTDKRSSITNDPNREDDKEYILRLIGQVVHVSVETVKIVKALPELGVPQSEHIGAN